MDDQQDEANKLYAKFETDVCDKIRINQSNHRLWESGQPRHGLKTVLDGLTAFADIRLDALHRIQLYLRFASDFFEFGEYSLALDCYELVSQRCGAVSNELVATKYHVEAIQSIVRSNYGELMLLKTVYMSPMVVSKLLLCLQELRRSLEQVFALPMKQQESLAWMVLNGCKLIVEIGQPLVWYSCGKYVTESLMFAVTAMEAVINLCTVRHASFRMKLYSSIFYSALSSGSIDQAYAVLEHTSKQIGELKEREELDPPVPAESSSCLDRCIMDIAVMRFVLDFWRDPDSSFSLADASLSKYFSGPSQLLTAPWTRRSFADLCAAESIRTHLLTAGNANEVFRKRSAGIAKGIVSEFSSYTSSVSNDRPLSGGVVPPDRTADSSSNLLTKKFSMHCLLEMTSLVFFYSLDEGEVSPLLNKLVSLAEEVESQRHFLDNSDDNAADLEASAPFECIKLLQAINWLSGSKTLSGSKRMHMLAQAATQILSIAYADYSYRSRAFLRKCSLELWSRHLYPTVQEALSDLRTINSNSSKGLSTDNGRKQLEEIKRAMFDVVKVLDAVGLDDAVLLGSLSLLCAQVQLELGEYRLCLSVTHQAITTLNEHRAARVDSLQHVPEDVRDIHALQRGSFTSRSDREDWFHSVKRLGAHAFAGYGIFGLASSADRGDQAMADIHAELVAFYVRTELQYSAQQTARKTSVRMRLEKEEATRTAHSKALLMGISKKPKKSKNSSATAVPPSTGMLDGTRPFGEGDATAAAAALKVLSLPIMGYLNAFCAKNAYYRCILSIEMARLEQDQARREQCLVDAYSAIEECEGREQQLKESFADLLVMLEADRRVPIVLSRSHRYIYVAPVGCRKLRKAVYYRVFAKEKGSGTGASVHNDDLGGCERRVYSEELTSLRGSVIRIGPLREGEQYVFASGGFDESGKMVGSISPSTPAVEAVNPLPTTVLWSWLTQIAQQIGYNPILSDVALRVADRYFMKIPEIPVRSVGGGINLFLFEEPSLCMLELQQSSPFLLHCLVESCLSYESLYQQLHVFHDSTTAQMNWVRQQPTQVAGLTTLHRTALVATVACGLHNHDLVLRCIKTGCDVAFELTRFDIVHLASYLQNPVSVLVVALQSIPKRNWKELEHKLYTKLCGMLVKVAAINRNVSPVIIAVLNSFYPEALSTELELVEKSRPGVGVLDDYSAVVFTVQQCIATEHLSSFLQQCSNLAKTLTVEKYSELDATVAVSDSGTKVGYLWSMSAFQRRQLLNSSASSLLRPPDDKAAPDRIQWEKWLALDRPEKMSHYLEMIVQLSKEALKAAAEEAAATVARSTPTSVYGLLERLPICKDFVVLRIAELSDAWGVSVLLQPIDSFAKYWLTKKQQLTPQAAPVKGAKPIPGAVPPDESALLAEARLIPERYRSADTVEEMAQLKAIAEIVYLVAVTGVLGGGTTTNHFPTSVLGGGPNEFIDPSTYDGAEGKNPEGNNSSQADISASGTTLAMPLPKNIYIQLLGAAMDMFREAGLAYSATKAVCRIWQWIVNEWMDPKMFANEFAGSRTYISMIFKSAVSLLESMAYASLAEEDDMEFEVSSAVEPMPPAIVVSEGCTRSYQREVKENMVVMRGLLIFLLKVEWIFGDNLLDVVTLGTRIFRTFRVNAPELLKSYGESCLPLIFNAQGRLVEQAKGFLDTKQQELDTFVFQYEEAQRKKRTKKLRVARLEKTDEELRFEAQKSAFEQKVIDARSAVAVSEHQMVECRAQQAAFDRLFSSGAIALGQLRLAVRSFVANIKRTHGGGGGGEGGGGEDDCNFAHVLQSDPDVGDQLARLQIQFAPVVSNLRGQKEKVLLVEALKLQGDLLLLFQCISQARSLWNDAIDGLFNTLDACKNWKAVSLQAVESFEEALIPGIIPAIVILSKLSRFSASNDLDSKARYVRMAASLCVIPFQESVGHPRTAAGFAAYECFELGGVFSLALRSEALSAADLSHGLQEIIQTLIYEQQPVAALPVVVLLEHFYAVYVSNASLWLGARLLRLKVLIDCHFFAESVAMVANITSTIASIQEQSIGDVLRWRFSSANKVLPTFEASENGLTFHGSPPYFNHLPPDDPTYNQRALQWLAAYPTEFENFAKTIKVALPVKPPTAEELQAAEELARKLKAEEEAAAAAAKKGKGAVKAVVPSPVAAADEPADKNTRPLFPVIQLAEVTVVVANMLIEVSMLEPRSTTTPAKAQAKIAAQGLELLTRAKSQLYSLCVSTSLEGTGMEELLSKDIATITGRDWLRLYAHIETIRNSLLIHMRRFQQVRAACTDLIILLRSEHFSRDLSGDARSVLAHLWFSARCTMVIIADRQARFSDVLDLTRLSIQECSMLLCGHWLRCFLFHRSRAHLKLGNLGDALRDIQSCIAQYAQNDLEDMQLVRCLCLQVSITREMSLHAPKANSAEAFVTTLELMRKAVRMAEALADLSGAFVPDSNVTYVRSDGAIKHHHLMSPLLHNLTDLHVNESDLSLSPQFNRKKLLNQAGITIPSLESKSSEEKSEPSLGDRYNDVDGLRLSPLDRMEGVYSAVEYVNIHLLENRTLITCLAALCKLLDDARNAGLADDELQHPSHALINEQLVTGEKAAKLLRHCVYLPIDVRISILVFQAKARIAKRSKFAGHPDEFVSTLTGPLTAALEIAIKTPGSATHLWPLLRAACMELSELYGDHSVDLGEEVAPMRLKVAVIYFLAAIKFSNQFALVTRNCIAISSDQSFDVNPTEELIQLVTTLSSSSATPDANDAQRRKATEATPPAATDSANAKGAKAAAPATAKGGKAASAVQPAAVATELKPNGRDALFLLCSMLREQDPLWLGSEESILCADLHALLRATYPIYAQQCCVEQVPDALGGSIGVPQGSVSTLYSPVRAPLDFPPSNAVFDYSSAVEGRLSHVSVFFLLGDAMTPSTAPSSSSNSNEPILLKLVLPRIDVVRVEKQLRSVRDRLVDAEAKANPGALQSARRDFGTVVCVLMGLLQNGIIIDRWSDEEKDDDGGGDASSVDRSFEIVESKATGAAPGYVLNVAVAGRASGTDTVSVPVHPQVLLHLADVCCPDRDVLLLKDGEVCRLLRTTLGYKVSL